MIKIENFEIIGLEHAIRGMRNPMNSWDKSDSGICKGGDNGIGCSNCVNHGCEHTYDHTFQIGQNDYELMMKLSNAGTDHRKVMRMITVYLDITAPFYWWKEFDTYKVGTVANSCSTMHKIAEKEFTIEDFSCEHLMDITNSEATDAYFTPNYWCVHAGDLLELSIGTLNYYRSRYLKTNDKRYWWQMIQLLPSSYNQKRTIMLNYEVLSNIYKSRHNHKLDEWHTLCDWIEERPYSEIITGYMVPRELKHVADELERINNARKLTPPIMKGGNTMRYFLSVNDRQLGTCLRMLSAEKIQPVVQMMNDKGKHIEFHISIPADDDLFEELNERYRILIS